MLNVKVVTGSLASFSAISFLVCVVYGVVVPETLHMPGLLEQLLPGFEWLTPTGVLVGLVESSLYGAYGGLVFAPLYNGFQKMWGTPST